MSDLPDDMSRWPSDPYALLGVTPGTPTREIRKSYTNLIRRFKPEHYPDHFRRIREAYDQVQQSEQWRTYAPPPESQPQPPPSDTTIPVDLSLEDAAPPPERPSEPNPPPIPISATSPSASDHLWDAACAGEHERVYRQLREQVQRGSAPEATYLQLYWLRVAFPEVDWDVKPIDWAIKAIGAGYEQGRAFEIIYAELLYRRELCRDAGLVALFDRVRNADAAARLFELRWRAALSFGQWSLVLDELPKAHARLFDHPQSLVSLLSWLVGYMAWSPEDHVARAMQKCRKDLEHLASGNRTLDYAMERLDFLDELVHQWRTMPHARPLHKDIRDFLPISWTGTLGQIRWRIFNLYQGMVGNVPLAIDSLDALAQSWPMTLAQITITAQQTYFASRGSFRAQPEDVKTVFREFFERSARDSPMRIDVLDFLARQRMTVDDFLTHVPFRESTEPVQNLLAQMANDNSLRLVNLAQMTLES